MTPNQRLAVSAGLAVAAGPVYWLAGLAPFQAAISSVLAFAGCAAAFLVPLRIAPARSAAGAPAAPPARVPHQAPPAGMDDLVSDGEAVVARIKRAARKLTSDEAVAPLMRIADAAGEGLTAMRKRGAVDPLARQVLAYYLPETAKLAETLVTIGDMRQPDPDTVATVVSTLRRLEKVFFQFADASVTADVSQLQRDLKLLDGTLDRLQEGKA
jgi:hypothetical protein